jgi:uncharacterized membrane protein YbaN (DUF454 family)
MTTNTETPAFDNISMKLIACGVIVVCLLLGFAGLILPLIPGLLFIAIAALVAAKLSPRFAEMLRQNSTLRGYLDRTEGIVDLPLSKKVQLAALLGVKMLIDGVAFLVAGVLKLVNAAERAWPRG